MCDTVPLTLPRGSLIVSEDVEKGPGSEAVIVARINGVLGVRFNTLPTWRPGARGLAPWAGLRS